MNKKERWEEYGRSKDSKILNEIIRDYIPFVRRVITRFKKKKSLPYNIDDNMIWDWALGGLLESTKKYDSNSGIKFRTYAFKRIQGSIIDGIRQWNHTKSVVGPYNKMTLSIEGILEQGKDISGFDREDSSKFLEDKVTPNFLDFIDELNYFLKNRGVEEREINMIMLRYKGLSLREIGKIIGLSESRVCQLLKEKIKPLESEFLKLYDTEIKYEE